MKALSHPDAALFVTQYYRPELLGSGPYFGDMAEWLGTEHSVDVHVLTGRPHYPSDAVFADYRSGAHDDEIVGGVAVTRLQNKVLSGGGAARRMMTGSHFFWRGVIELARGRVQQQSVVVSLCPSILTVILGIVMTRRGGRHVTVIHDIESGLAEGLGMVGSSVLIGMLKWIERTTLNRTKLILVLSENMRDQLIARNVKVPILLLPIWIDTDATYPLPSPSGKPVSVLYSGNFGKKQGLSQVLDAAEILQRENSNVKIVLRGEGREAVALSEAVSERGLRNIEFHPLMPASQLNQALAEGDIHLVPQNPNAADFAVPSKIFGIMAAGRPFIATAAPGSQLAKLCDEAGAFICVPPNDPGAFARAVQALADNQNLRAELGARGRAFVLAHHAKPKVLRDFFDAVYGD